MLKQLLEQHVEMFEKIGHPALLERFVLRNMMYEADGKPYAEKRGKPKMCFMNATHLALETGLRYVEGFCTSKDIGFPFHHAWCDDGGDVVDPTLKNPENYEYIGVEIPDADLIASMDKWKDYGVLDYGMINHEYLYKRDPELKKIVDEMIKGR